MIGSRSILHLSLIDGIGPAAIQVLLDKKPDLWQWHDVYQMSALDFKRIFGFSEDKAQRLVEGLSDQVVLEKELELIEKHKIGLITILDEAYPKILKHIHLPPAVLYFQGRPLNDSDKGFAVVGARAMNWYGKKAVSMIVPQLVSSGLTILSGGAIGIDSVAHRTALEHGGKTIAVLGAGLLEPYPSSNKNL